MQKVLIFVLAAATLGLAVWCGVQGRQLSVAQTQLRVEQHAREALAGEQQSQAERVRELERVNARLENQVQQFATVTTTLRTNEAVQRSNLTALAQRLQTAPAGGGGEGDALGQGMGEMIGKMMKDPAMREMMREQQKAVINMMYGGLYKELNLSPEEKDRLKELLTDAQLGNMDAAQGLLGGTADAATKAAATKAIEDAKKQTDAGIKALLGEGRFAQYEEYQKSVGERMQIDQFKSQIAADGPPLRDDQSAQLLQIMKEEKLALPPVIPTDQNQIPDQDSFTAEKVEGQLKWMEQYNARVTDRARSVLTPEQFASYQKFQEQQQSMQKLGMQMARQMFGGDKSKGVGK